MAFMVPVMAWAAANAGTIAAVSAATAAVGTVAASQAQARTQRSAQQAAQFNATVERDKAAAQLGAASANELAQRRDNDVKLSFERARMIESGGGLVGTNVGALGQAGENLELSALNTRYRGATAAVGDLQQSTLDQYQAQVAGSNARADVASGWIGAAGAALGTASNYYNARAMAGGF